jgi:DNA-binding MurR/RpiR family transcriptional regulator
MPKTQLDLPIIAIAERLGVGVATVHRAIKAA